MQRFRRGLSATATVLSVLAVTAGAASAAPTWAPAATAPIHPGVMTYTGGSQCTANFVLYDATSVYIGQAAHCSGTGGATETNGCLAASRPVGTPVEVGGATRPGTMVYNSWITMQARRESNANTCQYNDFALVKLDPADAGRVNPSIPHWGGPVGINTAGTAAGDTVYSYGNSSLRLGITQLSPKRGVSLGTSGGGWTHPVYTITPGVPGDSGSAFLDQQGRALGVLSTLALLPLPASNGVGDFSRELGYMNTYGNQSATLAAGTEPFNGDKLPLGVSLSLLG